MWQEILVYFISQWIDAAFTGQRVGVLAWAVDFSPAHQLFARRGSWTFATITMIAAAAQTSAGGADALCSTGMHNDRAGQSQRRIRA